MEYTLERSKHEIQRLHEVIADLERSYTNCDWNDAVHASFLAYVRACKGASFEINQAMRDLESSCSYLRNINPNRLIQESESTLQRIRDF